MVVWRHWRQLGLGQLGLFLVLAAAVGVRLNVAVAAGLTLRLDCELKMQYVLLVSLVSRVVDFVGL